MAWHRTKPLDSRWFKRHVYQASSYGGGDDSAPTLIYKLTKSFLPSNQLIESLNLAVEEVCNRTLLFERRHGISELYKYILIKVQNRCSRLLNVYKVLKNRGCKQPIHKHIVVITGPWPCH